MVVDVIHVLTRTQFAVGDIEKIGPTGKGPECVPGLDVGVNVTIAAARSVAGKDAPVIVFVQSGMGLAILVDTTNQARIDDMNAEIKAMCDVIKSGGADLVFASTLHYQWTHRRYPENEPVAVRAFNKRNYPGFRAIDLVTPTLAERTLIDQGDRRHANPYGTRLAGLEWFKELCRNDGIPVPAWTEDSLAALRKKWSDYQSNLPYTGSVKGRYKVGNQITVTWANGDCSKLDWENPVRVWVSSPRLDTVPHTAYNTRNGQGFSFNQVVNCADRKYTLTVSERWFSSDNTTYKYGEWAHPIEIGVSTTYCHSGHCSTLTGSNPVLSGHGGPIFDPDNVILIYPSKEKIDTSLPVYPGFFGNRQVVGVHGPASSRRKAGVAEASVTYSRHGGLLVRPGVRGRLDLTDAQGRLVASRDIASGSAIPIDLAHGVYLYRLQTTTGVSAGIFTVNHQL